MARHAMVGTQSRWDKAGKGREEVEATNRSEMSARVPSFCLLYHQPTPQHWCFALRHTRESPSCQHQYFFWTLPSHTICGQSLKMRYSHILTGLALSNISKSKRKFKYKYKIQIKIQIQAKYFPAPHSSPLPTGLRHFVTPQPSPSFRYATDTLALQIQIELA